jgi:hypothetical protein
MIPFLVIIIKYKRRMFMYCITNGYWFIKRNKNNSLNITENKEEAITYDTLTKANNVVDHMVKKFKKYNMKAIKLENTEIYSSKKKYDIKDELSNIDSFITYIKNRKLYLSNLLSQEDMKIVDIEHAAEFYKLNAARGYKLYRMLHEARINRRKIKDELEEIEILEHLNFNMTKAQQMINSIKQMENKKYRPRILEELFN